LLRCSLHCELVVSAWSRHGQPGVRPQVPLDAQRAQRIRGVRCPCRDGRTSRGSGGQILVSVASVRNAW